MRQIAAHRLLLPALLVVLAAVVYRAPANHAAAPGPAMVATLNLARVLDGLQQRSDAEIELKAMTDSIQAEKQRREGEIDNIKRRLEGASDASDRQRLEEEMALTSFNYQAWIQFVKDKVDVERALLLQDLYRSITNAVGELAEAEGYDLVLVDDTGGELRWTDDSPLTREAQTLQQIRGRRVLYGSSAIDVTDNLVARMNNAHRTGSR